MKAGHATRQLIVCIDGARIGKCLGQLSCSGNVAFTSVSIMMSVKPSASLSVAVEDVDSLVCSSAEVCLDPLSDEGEWIELKSICDADGTQSRLLSRTLEASHDSSAILSRQWSFTVDVKHCDSTGEALLRSVHVLERLDSTAPTPSTCSTSSHVDDPAIAVEEGEDCLVDDADATIAALSRRSYQLQSVTGRVSTCEMRRLLDGLLAGDVHVPEPLLRIATWRELASDCGLTVHPDRSLVPERCLARSEGVGSEGVGSEGVGSEGVRTEGERASPLGEALEARTREALSQCGHSQLPPSTVDSTDGSTAGISPAALAKGIERLRSVGLPPVFIFMFDEAWRLCARCGELVRPLMGDAAKDGADAELDGAVFAWALQPTPAVPAAAADIAAAASGVASASAAAGGASAIGSNFGRPHRDSSYAASHTPSGGATELTVWVALTPCTTTNGCMMVVPSHRDPLFASSTHPMHMQPDRSMPWAYVRPLTCEAGTVLLWHASLIHWGAACDEGEAQPRKSIAFAYKLPSAGAGRASHHCVTRAQLVAGLSLRERLHLIMHSLLRYEHWHPQFSGLVGSALERELA